VIEHGITLKKHFKDAQQPLEVRGPSMLQAGFAHANHLAQEIRQEIKHSNKEIANILVAYEVKEESPTTSATGSFSNTTDSANAATKNSQLLKTIQEMQKQMLALQTQVNLH